MKKILKYLLLLVYCIIMLMPNVVSAETGDYEYGVVNSVYEYAYAEEFVVWIGGNDSEEMCFARKTLKVNGEMVTLSDEDALSELLSGKMVQYTVNADGYLESINYDTDVETVLGARYDAETDKFDCVDEVLPVYRYWVDDVGYTEAAPIYLDENHSYDIEVSDYGINIVDFKAIGAESTIKGIWVWDETDSDLKKSIAVDISADILEEFTPGKGELYNSKSELVATSEGILVDNGLALIEFSDLPNETETYTIKIWLEDEAGERISLVYTVEYEMETDIEYGYIGQVWEDTWGYIWVRIYTQNSVKTYEISDKLKVNGESVELDAEGLNTLLNGEMVQHVVDERGYVEYINYDTDVQTVLGARYDEATGKFDCVDKVLPVYKYWVDDVGYTEAAPIYLDENHSYDIEVSDCGINIVDFKAIGADATIKEIYISDEIESDLKKNIWVDIVADVSEEYTPVKGELYNSKSELVATSEGIYDGGGWIEFSNLPNETETYTIKLWLENDEGEKTSLVYTMTYEIKPAEIKYGVVSSVYLETGADYPSVCILDDMNNTESYQSPYIEIHGEWINTTKNYEALDARLKGKYIQYAVQDGILHLNYDIETSFISGNVDAQTGELSAVLHNNYGETKTGVLIIATYAGGRLEKATSKPMSVAPLSSVDISETVELTSKTDEVKLFFWDNLTNVQSYGKKIIIDVK